jgi:hypothetical protein
MFSRELNQLREKRFTSVHPAPLRAGYKSGMHFKSWTGKKRRNPFNIDPAWKDCGQAA